MSLVSNEIDMFIKNWTESTEQTKQAFLRLKEYLASKSNIDIEFIQRVGITSSLRAARKDQKNRPFFILIDVIEDHPRWLSICFYNDMISDNDDKGVFIPKGISGDDAICFDLEVYDEEMIQYLEALIDQAYQCASSDS